MSDETNRKVLVIDDDPAILETLGLALSVQNFEVTQANNGMAGVDAARQAKFGLVITDMKMPGMSGLETLAALKQIDPTLPVIVVTGFASGRTESECKNLGAFEFIRKPFALEELFSSIDRALKGKGQGLAA